MKKLNLLQGLSDREVKSCYKVYPIEKLNLLQGLSDREVKSVARFIR